jgi:hypothetical protein
MIANRRKANSATGDGHGALNGMQSYRDYLRVGSCANLEEVQIIALVTDGMLPPVEDAADESVRFALAVELLKTGGVCELLEYTREVEEEDVYFTKARTKKHDDATGVSITRSSSHRIL